MKLAVSAIAWPNEADEEVAARLRDAGVAAIEAAPTKWWPRPLEVDPDSVRRVRAWWEARGLPIVAAQALLFGRPDLTLFDDDATRERTLEYLGGFARLCGSLGAGPLVFGAPKNRRLGHLEPADGRRVAIDFFRRLGDAAAPANTIVAIEANPPDYGGDFLTRADEALDLVRAVDHPHVRLHLDTACMTMAGDGADVIGRGADVLAHFHVSEPMLAPVGDGGAVDHAAFAAALRRADYTGWISIEMRQPDPFTLESLQRAVQRVREQYA
jgi:sugar phosphate isomerase/epimerase